MVQNSGKSENQHYVPQFLLRNFSIPQKSNQIYVFDKHIDRAFSTNIKNIASERDFYNFNAGEESISLEGNLSSLEAEAQKGINNIIENESLKVLSYGDKSWIALFVAVQFLRVKKQREVLNELTGGLAEHIRKMDSDSKKIEMATALSEEDIKMMSLECFVKNAPVFLELLSNKIWLLYKYPEANPLYISDNPVVMHNDEDFGPYGNIGFAVPKIQIYLPICSYLALGFWCPSMEDKFRENVAEIEKMEREMREKLEINPHIDREHAKLFFEKCQQEKRKPFDFIDKVNSGLPIIGGGEQVTFLNSLQVKWSHRFVMCSNNDFALVERMISDDEKNREGMKLTFN